MVRALLLFLLFLVLARAVWRLIEGVARGAVGTPAGGAGGARSAQGAASVKMVQDPVCGTFVVPGNAISLVKAGQTVYFCSDECREKYR